MQSIHCVVASNLDADLKVRNLELSSQLLSHLSGNLNVFNCRCCVMNGRKWAQLDSADLTTFCEVYLVADHNNLNTRIVGEVAG